MALTKDPDAVLDYTFDWSAWLADGETIASFEVAVEVGDVIIDSANNAVPTLIVMWVSGGTLGTNAEIRCRITTSAGRTDDRTITLLIREPSHSGGCEPWPIIGCDIPVGTDPDVFEAAKAAAQLFLGGLTANRLGRCTRTERYQVRRLYDHCMPPLFNRECCAITLAHSPVQAVLDVKVDGVSLAAGTYRIVGGNKLVRGDLCWPSSTDCNPGRITVTYVAGIPVGPGSPHYGIVGAAMGEATKEYIEAMCGRVCKLPSRFASVSRQGVSVVGLDPSLFLRLGLTGMPLTDNLVRTVNPHALKRKPRVLSIDGARRH